MAIMPVNKGIENEQDSNWDVVVRCGDVIGCLERVRDKFLQRRHRTTCTPKHLAGGAILGNGRAKGKSRIIERGELVK